MAPLLWVVKTAGSKSLSHSDKKEQLKIFSQAQRTSRRQKVAVKLTTARRQNHAGPEVAPEQQISGLSSECESDPFWTSLSTLHADCHTGCCNGGLSLDEEWLLPMLNSSLGRNCEWTLAERRSVAYFQDVTVYKILTLQRDIKFWKGVVPCLAELHPGIRHLVVAIAATFELLFLPNSRSLNSFALKQCNKALRSILSGRDMDIFSLTTSCILVSAYNLLRSDIDAADNSIESGLKMVAQTTSSSPELTQLSRMLTSLGRQHGFKLWAPDITFQFDKTMAGREALIINPPFVDRPFISASQVLTAFKSTIVEYVARLMRNLSFGAHIDPDCSLAQDIGRHFREVFHCWRLFYDSLLTDDAEVKLDLVQLKIGLLMAYLIFVAKVTESDEVRSDAYEDEYAEILQLGEEVIAARRAGRVVIYLDRIVNGALYTTAMMCRDPLIRQGLISLLKGQIIYVDGLCNYLRGRIVEVIREVEEGDIVVSCSQDIPENRRIRIFELDCRQDRVLCVRYAMVAQTDRLNLRQHLSRLDAELDGFNVQDIECCLKGMSSAHAMYMKADICIAPDGFLRKTYYGGKPVPVCWRADLTGRHRVR